MPTKKLAVPELGCDGCETIVEGAVSELDDVTDVVADQDEGTVTVDGDGFDLETVIDTVELAGYEVIETPQPG